MTTPRRMATVVAALLLLATAACGGSSDDSKDQNQAASIAIADQWVKATEGDAMADMSAAFGVLSNSSDEDAVITSVSSSITDTNQLHETVEEKGAMTMKEVDSFTVPAGGSFTLEPGGNHLMLMDLKDPIEPGQKIDFTLTFKDGSTFDFTATAKEFSGADEKYSGGDSDMDMN